jgi:hypothetical protein
LADNRVDSRNKVLTKHHHNGSVTSIGTAANGQNHHNSVAPSVAGGNPRNQNILCAVLSLIKELDESGLEMVKRDVERKLQAKSNGH